MSKPSLSSAPPRFSQFPNTDSLIVNNLPKKEEFTYSSHEIYKCSEPSCGKRFLTKSALEQHAAIHKQETVFPCPYSGCGQVFSSREEVILHFTIHETKKSSSDHPVSPNNNSQLWKELHTLTENTSAMQSKLLDNLNTKSGSIVSAKPQDSMFSPPSSPPIIHSPSNPMFSPPPFSPPVATSNHHPKPMIDNPIAGISVSPFVSLITKFPFIAPFCFAHAMSYLKTPEFPLLNIPEDVWSEMLKDPEVLEILNETPSMGFTDAISTNNSQEKVSERLSTEEKIKLEEFSVNKTASPEEKNDDEELSSIYDEEKLPLHAQNDKTSSNSLTSKSTIPQTHQTTKVKNVRSATPRNHFKPKNIHPTSLDSDYVTVSAFPPLKPTPRLHIKRKPKGKSRKPPLLKKPL